MSLPLLATVGLSCAVAGGVAALSSLRRRDTRDDDVEYARLAALQPTQPARHDPAALAACPEPVRRYFGHAIAPGAPLWRVAMIDMRGQFSLGTRERPGWRPMLARQILAAPHGFVWAVNIAGTPAISGSDSGRWTRFRLAGLLPVARQGGDADHRRSAFGRGIAEAAFWTPAALLPGPGIEWQAPDGDTARVCVTHDGLQQSVDLHLDELGCPRRVSFQRWSNANPAKRYQLQPFGGMLSDFREVEGQRLPFRVEAGNHWGTDAYFPFFKAEVMSIHFPRPAAASG